MARYNDFLDRTQLLTQKLSKQGYVAPRLKSSLQKCYVRHPNPVEYNEISIFKWQWIFSFYVSIFSIYIYTMSNIAGVNCLPFTFSVLCVFCFVLCRVPNVASVFGMSIINWPPVSLTSTLHLATTLGSVASLLAAILYPGHLETRTMEYWFLIVAHLLHILVLLLCYYIKIESLQWKIWSHSFSRTVLLSRSVLTFYLIVSVVQVLIIVLLLGCGRLWVRVKPDNKICICLHLS